MFNVGGGEILVILVIALLVLGPERLPTAGRQIGRALAEFRRVSSNVQTDLREALQADELVDTVNSLRDAVDIRGALKDELSSVTSAFTLGGTSASSSSSSSGSSSSSSSAADSSGGMAITPPDGLHADDRPSNASSGTIIAAPPGAFRDVLADTASAPSSPVPAPVTGP